MKIKLSVLLFWISVSVLVVGCSLVPEETASPQRSPTRAPTSTPRPTPSPEPTPTPVVAQEGFKLFKDVVAGVAIQLPESWLVQSDQPGGVSVFQSYPEGKYVGGEGFQPGDTKCDLAVSAPGVPLSSEVDRTITDPSTQVLSEREVVLNGGAAAVRIHTIGFSGEAALILAEINERVITFVCFGSLLPFDEIAYSLVPLP